MKTSESELAFVLLTGLASNDLLLTRADTRRTTRAAADRDNLIKERSTHELRNRFFAVRVIEEWNSLQDSVKEASSAAVLRRLLSIVGHTSASSANSLIFSS